MQRPKHPDPALEKLLRDAEKRKWRVIRAKKYYKIYCPCPERHKATVHITPSTRYYPRHRRQHLERYTCWKEEEA